MNKKRLPRILLSLGIVLALYWTVYFFTNAGAAATLTVIFILLGLAGMLFT